MTKKNQNLEVEAFIKDVVNGKNVKAKERLERILKVKTAKRIKDTLMS